MSRLAERLAVSRRILTPPPKLTVSAWADRHRVVSGYSAEPGPWRTARTPYLREIMDSFSDPLVTMVVFQKCARIGGTEAGLNIIGYFIDQDPSPILIVQPTVDDAKDFSKEQLAPMLADSPALTGKVKDPRSRDSGNTVQSKEFPGGGLYLVGANSPRGFRRRTVRVLDLEEIDGYPASAGTEGDQIKLAIRRTTTFAYRRKIYMNSTPTLKGLSRIEDYYLRSDQRRFHVPCPHCGHRQALVWGQLRYDGPEPLYYCVGCGAGIAESAKFPMVQAGQWVVGNPDGEFRGYHINALYSPWVSWTELVAEWQEAQTDIGKLQVFVNTVLGETWEERGGGLEPDTLRARREMYAAPVPAGVGILTAGVDVQDDRLEVSVWGWGAGEEAWIVEHRRLLGDPTKPEVWGQLDQVLFGGYQHESGATLTIATTCVDSGAHTESVYRYCRPRWSRRVYATKGASMPGTPLVSMRAAKVGRGESRTRLHMIGPDAGKDRIYGMLRMAMPGPGYVHLPHDLADDVIDQLTAERVMKRQMPGGRWVRRYECPRGVRNEALDCAVLALAAQRLSPVRPARLEAAVQRVVQSVQPAPVPVPEEPSVQVPTPPVAPKRRGPMIVGRFGGFGRFR